MTQKKATAKTESTKFNQSVFIVLGLSRPANNTFPIKHAALDGGREFFCLCFRRLQKAAENISFFQNRPGNTL